MSIIPHLFDLERPLRTMEREFLPREDVSECSPFKQLVPHDFFKPWNNMFQWENLLRPVEELSSAVNQMALNEGSRITADDEKFQVNIDVQHFAPDEIDVKVVNGNVVVKGKHEEKKDQHGFVSRQFVRRYTLPQGCLPDTVESKLSSDGVLTVTAPKVLPLPSIGERIVPIAHTGPVKKQLGSPDRY